MKAILMSDRPQWVVKIINGKKTLEVRNEFPKDYVGWVYIYCTKAKHYTDLLINNTSQKLIFLNDMKAFWLDDFSRFEHLKMLNGKVVARFWCDNVGIIKLNYCFTVPTIAYTTFADKYYSDSDLQVASCLSGGELTRYLGTDKKEVGFAIPISKLEIFDKPKEINEFYKGFRKKYYKNPFAQDIHKEKNALVQPIKYGYEYTYPLAKAPQNWCYIEVEE